MMYSVNDAFTRGFVSFPLSLSVFIFQSLFLCRLSIPNSFSLLLSISLALSGRISPTAKREAVPGAVPISILEMSSLAYKQRPMLGQAVLIQGPSIQALLTMQIVIASVTLLARGSAQR